MRVVFIIRCILFVSNVCRFSLLKIHAKRRKQHLLLFYSYVSMTTTKSKASKVSSSGVSRTLHSTRNARSKRTKHLHPEKRLDASSSNEEDQGTHLTEEEERSDEEDDSFDDDRRKTGTKRRRRRRTDRKGGGGGVRSAKKIADESELLFPLRLLGKKERMLLLRSPETTTTTRTGVIKKEKTSIRKHAAENVYRLVACCLQSGDFELAARTTAALLAISRKRMYREEEALEDGGRNEDNEEEKDEDEEANERRRKRKALRWHHKVERNDWETHMKHERLAMKSCLELMSGGRGGEEEEEEERDAKVIYANLLKEANVGGERHQARFESAFGEFFRAARRKAREARVSTEKAKALRKAKRRKALPHASRFGGYDEEEKEEEEKEEKEDNKLEINLGPEVTEAVRLLEGRGVKMCNFFPKDKKKKLRSSTRLLTDAAMLKVALWFESVKDETVRKHVLRLEMCRSPLTSKEIEMKRRGKSIAKTLDARAESGAYGDDSLRTSALISISSLLEARATKNNNSNNERQDINANFSSASSSDDAIKLTIAFAMLTLAKNPANWQEPEMTMVTVDEQLRKLVEEFPNDKDAREALATFLIRAYARGYRKDHAERSRKGFAPPKSRPLDCMDAQNIASACLAAVRVDPTCEISTRFLMHCWKYNYKAENVQRVEGIDFLEDAFDDDDEGSINEAGDNFSAMDTASVAYIGSAIDVNELLHVACERVECFPKDEQSWKYLSTALVGVETCIGENDDAHARQYEIIFQNVSTNRTWWPERMFANPKEITFSNIALCKYKAVAACIAFPFDERCKRYVSTFQAFLTKNAKSSPKFSSVRSLLSFLKDSVEVKYERLLTPKNKKVERKRDRVTKSHEGKNRKESEDDELKVVEVDDAML